MPYPYYSLPTNPYPSAPPPSSGLIWVQGENGAKSYLVSANNTVLLMDSEAERFYIKSVDASGMPRPLRIFEYKEVGVSAPAEYVTKAEFEKALAELKKDE